MEENNQLLNDLNELVQLNNEGREGYEAASKMTYNPSLKVLFLKFAAERAIYIAALKAHMLKYGLSFESGNGGVLSLLHRTWTDIKTALGSKEEVALLSAIEKEENAALAQYDKALTSYEMQDDHLYLFKRQRDGILNALKEIEVLRMGFQN